jgi:hypothetical protein
LVRTLLFTPNFFLEVIIRNWVRFPIHRFPLAKVDASSQLVENSLKPSKVARGQSLVAYSEVRDVLQFPNYLRRAIGIRLLCNSIKEESHDYCKRS